MVWVKKKITWKTIQWLIIVGQQYVKGEKFTLREIFLSLFFSLQNKCFFYYYHYLKTSKTSKRHHFCKLNGNLPNIKNELKEKEVKTDLKKKKNWMKLEDINII